MFSPYWTQGAITVGCAAVERQAIQTWQDQGASAAVKFLDGHVRNARGEDHYRLLAHKAKFLKLAGKCSQALSAFKEAIDGLKNPENRVDALVSAMDLCAHSNRTDEGLQLSAEADLAFEDCHSKDFALEWRATWHHNTGRLFALDGKPDAARVHLSRALDLRKTLGQIDWAHDTALILAECWVQLGSPTTADELCRWVRLNVKCSYIKFRLDVVSARVAIALQQLDDAQEYLDMAEADLTDKLGAMDTAVFIDMLFAEAELCAARSENLTAARLRLLAQRVKSASRGVSE